MLAVAIYYLELQIKIYFFKWKFSFFLQTVILRKINPAFLFPETSDNKQIWVNLNTLIRQHIVLFIRIFFQTEKSAVKICNQLFIWYVISNMFCHVKEVNFGNTFLDFFPFWSLTLVIVRILFKIFRFPNIYFIKQTIWTITFLFPMFQKYICYENHTFLIY